MVAWRLMAFLSWVITIFLLDVHKEIVFAAGSTNKEKWRNAAMQKLQRLKTSVVKGYAEYRFPRCRAFHADLPTSCGVLRS